MDYLVSAGHNDNPPHDIGERYDFLAGVAPLEAEPDAVAIRSNRLRSAGSAWIRIDRFGWCGAAELDAARDDLADTVEVTARNVERFTILSTPDAVPYAVTVNGVACGSHAVPVTISLTLNGDGSVAAGGEWAGSAEPLAKTASREGPTGWGLAERFVVAYGSSGDAAATDANRLDAEELCRAWADDWSGAIDTIGSGGFNALITPVDEAALTRHDVASSNLVIFGSEESSSYVARVCLDPTLPFNVPARVLEDQVVVDGHTYPVPPHGIWMAYPNPLAPERLIIVGKNAVGDGEPFFKIEGDYGEVFWTREAWPWGWPDWIVFDNTAPMRAELDGQPYSPDQYVAAGMFDRDWDLVGSSAARTVVEVTTDAQSYPAGALPGDAVATATVVVTDELGSLLDEDLTAANFALRIDGEKRTGAAAPLFVGETSPGSYEWSVPVGDLPQFGSVDTDPAGTTYDLTVEVVRPHPSDGAPLAGLGRAQFTMY
jgi:hypothetical protein